MLLSYASSIYLLYDMQPFKILIAQKKTLGLANTYAKIAETYGATIDFRAFTEPEVISLPTFRIHKPKIVKHTAFLFTNRITINSFFSLAKACSITFPTTTKYFLATEQLQKYLKEYIEIKKRKIFCGKKKIEDLFPILPRHKEEKFFFPCSQEGRKTVNDFFKKKGYKYTKAAIYANKPCDLSDLKINDYDLVVFFSPFAIQAFAETFPDHQWERAKIAVFSTKAQKVAKKMKWPIAFTIPTPESPTMLKGITAYLEKQRSLQ